MSPIKSVTKPPTVDRRERHAITIAHHFGFRPLEELTRRKLAEPLIREVSRDALPAPLPDLDPSSEEAKRVFSLLLDRGHLPSAEPLFLFWHPKSGRSSFALGIIGSPLPIAEALLIKMGCLIAGGGKHDESSSVAVGSMGDKESAARFAREAMSAVRKHEQSLPRETRLLMRDNPFRAIKLIHEAHPEVAAHLPSPMDFLSDKSRLHFKEVLLHLEAADIPYMMQGSLVGSPEWHSDTLFEIRTEGEGGAPEVFARGARYDEYVRRLARLRVGGVILFFSGKTLRGPKPSFPKERAPFAFFIHIGVEARQIGVSLMDSLRGLHIPVRHALGTSGFREQLEKAERLKAPFAIIMGQKEAHDKIVIVRDMVTRAQDYIPITTLPDHLARLAARKRR